MVNGIMAAAKTAGSAKAAQSKKNAADDKSVFTQALSTAANAVNSMDNQTADKKTYDKKTYDKKDTADTKESTEAVKGTDEGEEVLAAENVILQEAFVSTMQMGADGSQMVDGMQAALNQAAADANGSLAANAGEAVNAVNTLEAEVQPGTVKELVYSELGSGEIPVEMMEQTEGLETLNTQTDEGFADQMSSMDTGASLADQKISKKDEPDVVDVKAEAAVSRGELSHVHGQTDAAETIQTEVEVTESGEIRQEYADMIKDMIARQIAEGKQELEISLTPRNLGELLVRVAYSAGETTVSIICNSEKAMHAMSSRASELGKVLETTLGDKMDVVVEQKEQNGSHLYEDGRNDSGAQAQKEELERREAELRRRLEKESSSADFLQQLRLGLT